jgi:hypothetical protein
MHREMRNGYRTVVYETEWKKLPEKPDNTKKIF